MRRSPPSSTLKTPVEDPLLMSEEEHGFHDDSIADILAPRDSSPMRRTAATNHTMDSGHKKRNSDVDFELNAPLLATTTGGTNNRSSSKLRALLEWLGLHMAPKSPRLIPFPAVPNAAHKHHVFPANMVRNQKYSLMSFVPMVLYEQFKYFFNLYFLVVALSQLIPALQIGYIFTYFAPLGFVLMVTMAKEAWDDIKRFRRDQEANSQKYERMQQDGSSAYIPSSKIRVGDLIVLRKNQRVPADMILLRTSEKSGACFIRTDQLDGETDWKLRVAIPSLQRLATDQQLLEVKGAIYADPPHKDIYEFIGNFRKWNSSGGQEEVEGLSVDNTLWANTVLASGVAVGFVVYTGPETRALMNTNHPSTKVGQLDLELNRLSKILCVFLFLLSLLLVGLSHFNGMWLIYLMRFLIIFSSIIPISLRVNLDMAKTYYSFSIMGDMDIPNTIVRSSTIPEELGRLEYLLTDKTEMELKKLHLGTMSYGLESSNDLHDLLYSALSTHDSGGTGTSNRYGRNRPANVMGTVFARHRDISTRVADVVQALAICHNVTPVIEGEAGKRGAVASKNVTYQASSPDEVAIVQWTSSVGLTLIQRDLNSMTLQLTSRSTPNFEELLFDVLHVFPFTSETKRMGIIVRERSSGELFFYMKGADTVMMKIVQYNDWLEEECGNMAREGLRTLVIGRKKLQPEILVEFERQYQAAKVSTVDRSGKMQKVVSNMLESDLELLGLTGVEDKLQDDVKPTLELLRNAGIKIWMLTGDKIETATNIAISSKLVSRNQIIVPIQRIANALEAEEHLYRLESQLQQGSCIVVDGQSLQILIDHYDRRFVELAMKSPSVVCCRCSPTQKAIVTNLVKKYSGKRVCAIGDGGNDVSMIQSACVGIGIVGKEGKQASLAADFSVTQFCHIARLFLWHGRNSYKRSAKLSQFIIHRGLIISIMQAVFSAMFYFAPIALYQGIMMVGYSTVYTMAPVFSLVLDKDINENIAMIYPELYKDLPKGRVLSLRTFLQWVLISVYQGGIIMLLAIWLFENEFLHIVSITFTALVFNELLMVAFEIITWHRLMVYSEVVTVGIYVCSMMFLKTEFDLSFILTWAFLYKTAIITTISSVPLYVIRLLRRRYAPPSYSKLT